MTLAPRFPIGGPLRLTALGDETRPAIATNGTIYMVAWTDPRATGIAFTRIDAATGAVLDPDGIKLDQGMNPSVAFGGGRFAIVGRTAYGTRAWLIKPDGEIVSSFLIVDQVYQGDYPVVKWNGQNFVLAWERSSVYGRRFSATGTVLDTGLKQLVGGTTSSLAVPRMDCGPTRCLVISGNEGTGAGTYTVFGIFDQNLNQTQHYLMGLNCCGVDVAWDGQQFTILGYNGESGLDLRAIRVGTDGTVGTPTLLAANTAPETIAWGSSELLAITRPRTTPYPYLPSSLVLGSDLTPKTPLPFVANDVVVRSAQSSFAGGSFLTVWEADPGQSDIWGRRTNPDGTWLGDPFLISARANSQTNHDVARGSDGYLVSWEDDRVTAGDPGVYAARVAFEGSVLEPTGFEVASKGTLPSVAFNGSEYLVAYQASNGGATARRVATDGQLLGSPIIGLGYFEPAVAWDGTQWIVATIETSTAAATRGVYVVPVALDGTVGVSQRLFNLQAFTGSLRVASDGVGETLVSWQSGSAFRARLSSSLTLLDPPNTALCTGCYNSSTAGPSIGFGGSQFFVALEDGGGNDRLNGTRLVNGAALDSPPFLVATDPIGPSRPRVGFTGSRFLVGWTLGRNSAVSTSAGGSLYATRVSSTGVVVDPSPIVIDEVEHGYGELAFAGGNNQALITFGHVGTAAHLLYGQLLNDDTGCVADSECPDDALACTTKKCTAGVCGQITGASSCVIGGVCYATSAANPADGCFTCQPGVSQTSFTAKSCPDDSLACTSTTCSNGTCGQNIDAGQCAVGSACYASGAADPGSACQTCDASVSQTSFTPIVCPDDALSCTTATCSGGACGQSVNGGSCLIGGVCYAASATDPGDACSTCQPALSQSAFSPKCADDGLTCTTTTCDAGACSHPVDAASCLIAGTCYTQGAANPSNACETCEPDMSQAAFTETNPADCASAGSGGTPGSGGSGGAAGSNASAGQNTGAQGGSGGDAMAPGAAGMSGGVAGSALASGGAATVAGAAGMSGGAAGSALASGGASGSSAGSPGGAQDSGCGCRVGSTPAQPSRFLAALALLGALVARRRRSEFPMDAAQGR